VDFRGPTRRREPLQVPLGSLLLLDGNRLLAKVHAEADHRSVNSWAISVFEAAQREKNKSCT
jgi:hypothetical protein